MQKEKLLVVATDEEYEKVKNRAPFKVLKTGIGYNNVINSLKGLNPKKVKLYNVGYVGSNFIKRGTLVKVKNSYNFHEHTTFPENSYNLGGTTDCYTSSDFVVKTNLTEPVVFDMELNAICAFGFEVESYKIVSDNLSLEEYEEADFEKSWKEVLNLIGKGN